MKWTVEFTSRARKQKEKLPVKVREVLYQLVREIEKAGPARGDWPNYSKLSDTEHHCHLKKGKPTYVAVWRESQGEIRLIEVIYAGSHEKRHTDDEMITLRLHVHRSNAAKIKEFVETIETGEERNYTVAEVFPEYEGKGQQVAIRAYRYRENLTQRQLSVLTLIPQRHISEMENGKRPIGKEMAKRLSKALNVDYKVFL